MMKATSPPMDKKGTSGTTLVFLAMAYMVPRVPAHTRTTWRYWGLVIMPIIPAGMMSPSPRA